MKDPTISNGGVTTPLICHNCWIKKTNHYGPCEHTLQVIDSATATDKATIAELTAQLKTTMEELSLLQFQSRLNDSDLPDAELIAALSDELLDISDDIDSPGSGTILSKVQCMKPLFAERDELRRLADQSASESGLFAKRMGEAQDAERAALSRAVAAEKERDEAVAALDFEGARATGQWAQKVIDELKAERDELQKDKERLEKVIERKLEVRFNTRINEWTVQLPGQVVGCLARGGDYRAAIDNAES